MNEEYEEFDLADNEAVETAEEVANPQAEEVETTEVQGETETTSEPSESAEKAPELTETQRVAQRIKEEKQKARDTFIAEQGYVWNGKPITTEAEYKQALEEQSLEAERQKLIDEGLTETVADKIAKFEKYMTKAEAQEAAELEAQREQQEAEARKQKDLEDFIEEYPDVDFKTLDKSIWEDVAKGKSLTQAFTKFQNKQLQDKLKTLEQNQKNKEKAPLNQGVTTHGSNEIASEDDFERGFNSLN